MFRSLKISLLVVSLALLGLAALPAYPRTETASLNIRPAEVAKTRTLLGENPQGATANSGGRSPVGNGAGSNGQISLTVPKLGLKDVRVPTADSQAALDQEGVIHLKDTGMPWQDGSNTMIVGHALGYMRTRVPYAFYKLDEMKPGDEILVKNLAGKEFKFRVYDLLTVRPEDYWVTYPVPNKTIVSLQTCTPIPAFDKRLIVRGELVGG